MSLFAPCPSRFFPWFLFLIGAAGQVDQGPDSAGYNDILQSGGSSESSSSPLVANGPDVLPPDPRGQPVFRKEVWIPDDPFDCRWFDWSHFSPCNPQCNPSGSWGNGTQSRLRSIAYPSYALGQGCRGPRAQTTICVVPPCDVDCSWGLWGPWSACTDPIGGTCVEGVTPGIATRVRNATPALGQGVQCQSSDASQQKTCDCPLQCHWQDWSDWSSCSASCGYGYMNRSRSVREHGQGWYCTNGAGQDSALCQAQSCGFADCTWDNWGDWGACSKSVNGAKQKQRRLLWLGNTSDCDQSQAMTTQMCNCDPTCTDPNVLTQQLQGDPNADAHTVQILGSVSAVGSAVSDKVPMADQELARLFNGSSTTEAGMAKALGKRGSSPFALLMLSALGLAILR